MNKKFILSFFISMLLLAATAYATSPNLLITEQLLNHYNTDGTLDSSHSGNINTGNLKVYIPSNTDVLQYVRVNVTDITKTNISKRSEEWYGGQTAWHFYRGSAANASPLYINDSSGTEVSAYNLNPTTAPSLRISRESFANIAGGTDIYSQDNIKNRTYGPDPSINYFTMTINLSLNPTSWRRLNNVKFNLSFNMNTNGTNDLFNIYSVADNNGTGTTCSIIDADADDVVDINETVNCTTSFISAGEVIKVYLNFTSETTLNIPYQDVITTEYGINDTTDGTEYETNVYFVNATTSGTHPHIRSGYMLSNMATYRKFARGPIRQGIDLLDASTWSIRGFIQNKASSLTYSVTNWTVRNVDSTTGVPNATPASSGSGWNNMTGGSSQYSNWYDTAQSGKPFYTIQFTWEVDWNGNEWYNNVVSARLNLGRTDSIDLSSQSSSITGTLLPETTTVNQTFVVSHNFQWQGNDNSQGQNLTLELFIPWNGTDSAGDETGFYTLNTNCSQLNVSIANKAIYDSQHNTGVTVVCTNSSAGTLGTVRVYVPDLTASDLGVTMRAGNTTSVKYGVFTSTSIPEGITFSFGGNATVYSESGTPITENMNEINITTSATRLSAYKDIIAGDIGGDPRMINVTINVSAVDQSAGGLGITNVVVLDYLPGWSNWTLGGTTIRYVNNSGTATILTNHSKVNVTSFGNITLSDGNSANTMQYQRNNSAAGVIWNGTLYDGDYLTITYTINITNEGFYTLPTEILALDPTTGRELNARADAYVTIKVPKPLLPLEKEEGEFTLAKRVIVGQPARWTKELTIYNPNAQNAKASFELEGWKDMESASATYFDRSGQLQQEKLLIDGTKIYFESIVEPLESRTYNINILTPAVLEFDRQYEVLKQIEEKKLVELKMDLYLKNYAEHDYQNILMNIPVPYENVIKVTDAFGQRMEFTGGPDSTAINIPAMAAGETLTVTVIMEQSYPTVLVMPAKAQYNAEDQPTVGLAVIVINGASAIERPVLQTEVFDPQKSTLYANINQMQGHLDPLEKTETTEEFFLPMQAIQGQYVANVWFRDPDSMQVLGNGAGTFYVQGGSKTPWKALQVAAIVLLGITMLTIVYRRARKIAKVGE